MRNLFYSALTCCGIFTASGFGGMMLGPGKWNVMNVRQCDTEHQYPSKIEVTRRKINRTCDGFNAIMSFDKVVDFTYAIRIEICNYVDGGCKPFQTMADECFEKFLKKYSAENVRRVLELANIDSADFPVPAGRHEMKTFVMNYDDLPENGRYGEFGCEIYIVKDGVDQLCIYVHTKFARVEDD